MNISDTATFEIFRLGALAMIYGLFVMQVLHLRISYRQHRAWAEEEAERRKRWAEDLLVITRLKDEALHLRHSAEVALAQARRHLPAAPD